LLIYIIHYFSILKLSLYYNLVSLILDEIKFVLSIGFFHFKIRILAQKGEAYFK